MSSLPIVSASSELATAQTPFHFPIKPALIGLGSLIALGGLCYYIKWLRQPDPYKKNLEKALEQQREKLSIEHKHLTATSSEVRMTNVYKGALRYEHTVTSDQNRSRDMQDSFTYSRTELGTVFGVFDGHGGHDISNYASTYFAARFFELIAQGKSHRDAFQRTILSIQNDIKNDNCTLGNTQGTTAVVCYIDPNHRIHTATLGDSEAKIYRMIGNQLKSIPISCMRDWCSPKDSLVFTEHRRPFCGENAKAFVQHIKAKDRRIGWHDIGLNVSRGIGVINNFYVIHPKVTINLPMSCLHLWPEMRIPLYFSKEGILRSIKPKITMFQPQPGDILILGSDGLFDSLPEHRIIEIISDAIEASRLPELTDILVEAAKQNKEYNDNITTVAVTFHPSS